MEVIGVVKDAHYARLREAPPPILYIPYTQRQFGWPQQMSFRCASLAIRLRRWLAIRLAVSEVDRMLPLIDVKTMEGQIDKRLAQERLFASLISLFGAHYAGASLRGAVRTGFVLGGQPDA